jgi:hypothetical protein
MKHTKRNGIFLCSALAAAIVCGVAVAGNPHQSSSSSGGVKPGSTTQHDTYAPAGSNQTKLYGNGKTAGQIAMQNGAASGTTLHGPGNSQPHKVAPCPNGHEVDVHALKSHANGACTTSSPPQASSNVAAASAASGAPATSARPNVTSSGVLGTTYTRSKPVTGRARPAHAVLGAAQFTG